ncbi:MAG: FAD-dependent oxidoreductase, partial [Gammaproteobacteria bacterium]|nr:FAD-dependent oxidoreductase [Gammaproteobacteria bacterium]
MQLVEIKIPDIGDFQDVPIVEVFVGPGDRVAAEDPLVALESDKATMEVPSPHAGTVRELKVKAGDTVSEGSLVALLEPEAAEETAGPGESETGSASASEDSGEALEPATPRRQDPASGAIPESDHQADLAVLGSGPGGYTAAFRAADLGLKVVLVERYDVIGGVCLNVGCIPSKALLHVAKVIEEAEEATAVGLSFAKPALDVDTMRGWKDGVVGQLTRGLTGLAKKRKVAVLHGTGEFTGPNQLRVAGPDGEVTVGFDQAVIAVGSEPVEIPRMPHDDPRVIDSTGALRLEDIPGRLLVVGGGIIGLEMATVYNALGSRISVVEMLDHVMTGADPDMVRPLLKKIKGQYENIWTGTGVSGMKTLKSGIKVSFEGPDAPPEEVFDKVLMAVGRSPNGGRINAAAAGVAVDERGFIRVDGQMRTNVPHIFAIGDVVGQPMLAHKAVHEGKVAAEVAAGMKSGFEARVIPSVAYTDPEVAWVGMTETEAKAGNIPYEK